MRTILLVEDDEAYAYAAGRAIGDAGYEVIAASDFSEALRVLESRRVDLLIVDIVMPGQPHGFALARMARGRVPSLPVVYITAHPDRTEPERDTALGEIVSKSLGLDALLAQIKTSIENVPSQKARD
jgi:two-component system, OmpR family, response regulator